MLLRRMNGTLRTTSMDCTENNVIGPLHTGTETRFSGSGSLIRIQCGLAWAPHEAKLCTLHCWTGSHALSWSIGMLHCMQLGSRTRLCRGKEVFGSGSPIHIVFRSKILCGEPHSDQFCLFGVCRRNCTVIVHVQGLTIEVRWALRPIALKILWGPLKF